MSLPKPPFAQLQEDAKAVIAKIADVANASQEAMKLLINKTFQDQQALLLEYTNNVRAEYDAIRHKLEGR